MQRIVTGRIDGVLAVRAVAAVHGNAREDSSRVGIGASCAVQDGESGEECYVEKERDTN